jgi:hypothetical protein
MPVQDFFPRELPVIRFGKLRRWTGWLRDRRWEDWRSNSLKEIFKSRALEGIDWRRPTRTYTPQMEQVDMLEQGIAETRGRVGTIFGNMADDFSQIVQRFLREEDAEIHLGRSSRTS